MSAAAFAGPSENGSRRTFETFRGAPAPTPQEALNRDRAPYALTGQRPERRVVMFRDVPMGRGQTQSIPFWTWVAE